MDNRIGPPDCKACWGAECHGGGNLKCAQRDPRPSCIAGILDSYGGTRVVVARRSEYKQHVRDGEYLCVYKGKLVHTPINWGDIPMVIRIGETAIEEWVKQHEQDNDPEIRHTITLYRLRKLEQRGRSLHLPDICYT